MKKGRVFGTIVFEESLVNDPSANIAYIYWGSLWEQTCCFMVDAELGASMHLLQKTVT